MLVLVVCLCPSSVRVVATFPGTVLFRLLCFVLPFFCLIHWFFSLPSFVITSKCSIPKINLRNIVHLVGFIIRIYHDARSPERRIICYISHNFSHGTRWWHITTVPRGSTPYVILGNTIRQGDKKRCGSRHHTNTWYCLKKIIQHSSSGGKFRNVLRPLKCVPC